MFVSLISHYNRFFGLKLPMSAFWSQITGFTHVWFRHRLRHLNVVLETALEESVEVEPDYRGRRRVMVCASLVHSILEHPALVLRENRGEPRDLVDPTLKVVHPLTELLDITFEHMFYLT